MKGIISTVEKANGQVEVYLLGSGQTERAARMAAYAFTHHGHNEFDDEFAGGRLVDFSPALADLAYRADQWDDVYDEQGRLVESHCCDAHHEYLRALGQLYVVGDELRYHV